jgi:hypothetical protein
MSRHALTFILVAFALPIAAGAQTVGAGGGRSLPGDSALRDRRGFCCVHVKDAARPECAVATVLKCAFLSCFARTHRRTFAPPHFLNRYTFPPDHCCFWRT